MRVRNFKRFIDQAFALRGLTVLTGLNSSGKSTMMQSILLCYQAGLSTGERTSLNAEPGLRLGQPVDLLALDARATRVTVDMVCDGEPRSWEFETQFEGFEDAHFVLRTADASLPARLSYLGAERLGPRTSHASAPPTGPHDHDVVLGDDGRYVAHALAVHARREVQPRLVHASQPDVTTLSSQTEAWMGELVGALQLDASLIPRTDLTTLHVRSSALSDWILPTNVGFGISYALPVVVAGLTAQPGDLLMIDSPEAHLHPAAQSAIARFLATVASCGVQVVIETHSDHVLNGVRRAVVAEAIDADDIMVHFLAGQSAPVQIAVDSRGRLSEWPPGFFDQLELDLHSITRPRRDRA